MYTWHWRIGDGLPYLTCSILANWSHGFFTQQFWPRSPLELVKLLQPEAKAYRVKQVHGNVVLAPSEVEHLVSAENQVEQDSYLPPADGLITELGNQAVWVASADCTPVLIADSKTGQVAAVHAGWRGTAAKIVPEAIAKLQCQGSELSNLRIAMGPAIAGSVYQVSTQVAAQVGASIVASVPDSDCLILESLYALPNSPLLVDSQAGRVRLDVRRVIALQLEQLGIGPEQVAIAPHCTYQEPEHFFSYRRDKLRKVQWSGIVSTL